MIEIFCKSPNWEDISVGRVTDHTVTVEHSNDFLQRKKKDTMSSTSLKMPSLIYNFLRSNVISSNIIYILPVVGSLHLPSVN